MHICEHTVVGNQYLLRTNRTLNKLIINLQQTRSLLLLTMIMTFDVVKLSKLGHGGVLFPHFWHTNCVCYVGL